MGSLQDTVDRLSQQLHQPVLVDDPALSPLAYSAHEDADLDAVRAQSILMRRTRPEIAHHLAAAGIGDAPGPMRVPGDPGLGFRDRWCVPIRSGRRLLGYAWVIAEREITPGEHALLERFTPDAAADIEQNRAGAREDVSVQRQLRTLLSSDTAESCHAAAALVDSGAFRADQHIVVLIARRDDRLMDDAARVQANLAVHDMCRELSPRGVLAGMLGDQIVCVIGAEDGKRLGSRRRLLAARLAGCLDRRCGDAEATFVAGAGSVVESLAGVAQSRVEADWACTVAGRIPDHGPIAMWEELGVYQLLAGVADRPEQLPQSLRSLLESANGDMLIHTLEAYLDTGGDAQATAARLFLARGSLYYRLHRIEEIAGIDLGDGGTRLTLHLGLKLARLTGAWNPGAPLETGALAVAR